MHLIWRRYSRSGYAPPAFYFIMAFGFVALAVVSAISGNWLIAAIAAVMAAVTLAGSRVMRGMARPSDPSPAALQEDDHV